jgi:hypothetical protein
MFLREHQNMPSLITLFEEYIYFFSKKVKALTKKNSKHKTFKIIFMPMSNHNTFSTKKPKTTSKKCYQTSRIYSLKPFSNFLARHGFDFTYDF